MSQHKYLLPEDKMPTQWYNIVPDLPELSLIHISEPTRPY